MSVRIRTYSRLGKGVGLVTYQSPKQVLIGYGILLLILYAILGSALWYGILALVTLRFFAALVLPGIAGKLGWGFAFAFCAYVFWTSHGCLGYAKYCAELAERRAATDAAIQREHDAMPEANP